MGGVGSGGRLDGEPRRLVEWCFALDVERVLEAGREPGTVSDMEIPATLIVWPVRAIVQIRRTDTLVATVLFSGVFAAVSTTCRSTLPHARTPFYDGLDRTARVP